MITKAFSIFDVKADAFSPPFFAPTNGFAIRQFTDLANDRQSTVSRHPGDFKLMCVGSFNDMTGYLDTVSPPESLGFASDFLRPSQDPEPTPLRLA